MGRVVHIEAKSYAMEAAVSAVRDALRARRASEITAADAAVISGFPLDRCEPALIALASRFPSRLRVTDEGLLLFRFDSLERPREGGRVRRAFRAFADVVGRYRERALAVATLLLACPVSLSLTSNVGAALLLVHALPTWAEVPLALVTWPIFLAMFSIAFLITALTYV